VDSRATELVRLLQSGAIQFDESDDDESSEQQEGGQRFPPPFSLN
jgi:hypothetical protein